MASGEELICKMTYHTFGEQMLYNPECCQVMCHLMATMTMKPRLRYDDIKPIVDYFNTVGVESPTYMADIYKLVKQVKPGCYGSPREVFDVVFERFFEREINRDKVRQAFLRGDIEVPQRVFVSDEDKRKNVEATIARCEEYVRNIDK